MAFIKHPTPNNGIFFSDAQGVLIKIDHIMRHKTNLHKAKSTEIIQSIIKYH
jgi:hypothetical protein